MKDRPESIGQVPADVWEAIVSNVPISSVDLIVQTDRGVLLARRQNKPARGEWFVPGGRVRKGETLVEAVHRVARTELGVNVRIEQELGAYNHFYTQSDIPGSGGKHYVAHVYVVILDSESFELDTQHDEFHVYTEDDLPPLHE